MKQISKIWVIFLLSMFVAAGFNFRYSYANKINDKLQNIILIGWDGTQREHFLELLSAGGLPNIEKLINEGQLVFTEATTGATQTKPGWAEILTGYSAPSLGIKDNKNYKPIPEGYTIFERLEEYFGTGNITTVFIGGKINNIGSRGPHKICLNCIARDAVTREKTMWWDKSLVSTRVILKNDPPLWVSREGEPYFNSKKNTDFHLTGLGSAEKVGEKALALLSRFHRKPFFAFFHFEEPDEQGHLYGENSVEYGDAMKAADHWLGLIVEKLKTLGIYEKTTIFVTSDHGMDEGGIEHENSPSMFFATNSKRKLRNGDRKDITPTILDEYGIDVKRIEPPLHGKSLF